MALLRRTRRFAPLLTLTACLATCECALSANADQSQPKDEQQEAEDLKTQAASPSTGPQRPPTTENQQAPPSRWDVFLDRLADPVTWFTGGLLWLAVRQYRAMRKQGDYMRQGLAETRSSIAEATRSAAAMERISVSMETSVRSVQASLAISKKIADTQMLPIVLQNRAHLEVSEWKVFKLSDELPLVGVIDPRETVIRYFVTNKGATAATLHSVDERIPTADVFRTTEPDLILESGHWVQRDIQFRLPTGENGERAFFSQQLTVKVEIRYSDGFATRTKRFGRQTSGHTALMTDVQPTEQNWFVCGGTEWNREIEHPKDAESA